MPCRARPSKPLTLLAAVELFMCRLTLKSGGNGNDSGSVIEVRRLGRLETRVTGRGAPDGLRQKVL